MKGFFAMFRGHKGAHVIVCGDETFLLTEATGDHTYALKGSKSAAIRNFCEKKGCTVMLSSAAFKDVDGVWGQKTIPPMVIWKATPNALVAKQVKQGQKLGYLHPYVAEVSENGWMTTKLFVEWTKLLPKVPHGKRGLIVLDVFAAHRCDESVKRLKSLNYEVAFIPGGCTSKLQVHDVYVNKSFKSEMIKWHADLRAKQGSADPVSRGAIGMQVGILNDEPSIRALLLRGMKKLIIEPMNKVDEDTDLSEKLQEDLQVQMSCDREFADTLGEYASIDDVIEIDDEVEPAKVHEVSDDEDDSDVTCLFDCLCV